MDAIRRLVRFLRLASRAAESQTGVTGAQLFVVQRLAEGPVSSMAELAGRTLTDPSSVSTVVARLVERGYVTRRTSREDRRRAEILLTAKGRAVVEDAPELAQLQILSALERMPPVRRRTLARVLEELVEASGAEDVAPKMFFEDEPEPVRAKAKTKVKAKVRAKKAAPRAVPTKKRAPAARAGRKARPRA